MQGQGQHPHGSGQSAARPATQVPHREHAGGRAAGDGEARLSQCAHQDTT